MIANQTPAAEYREIVGRFTALVEGVPDDATWNRRSPVPEWTARDVVGHLDETLDPQRCAVMLEGMQPLDELLRSSGQYGRVRRTETERRRRAVPVRAGAALSLLWCGGG